MKITKNAFLEKMQQNTIFLGVTKVDYTKDEIECALSDFINDKAGFLCVRATKKITQNYILFNDDSRLDLSQIGDYVYNYFCFNDKQILSVTHNWTDVCDGKKYLKAMYYAIA